MTGSPHIARKYATAFLSAAGPKNALGKAVADLNTVAASYRAGDKAWDALEHPLVSESRMQEVLKSIFGGKVEGSVLRLVALLAARRRLKYLPQIASAVETAAELAGGIVRAQVRSAKPLTDAQRSRLQDKLARFTQGPAGSVKVVLEVREDPALVAGVSVKIGDWFLERSLRSELRQI